MQPVEQTKTDGRGGGNCVAACVASIFEVDIETVTVPCGGSYSAMCEWTAREFPGLYPIHRIWDDGIEPEAVTWPEPFKTWWIASVESPRTDGLHCIVMHGSDVIYDPHPQREQGHGLCKGMTYWIVRDPSKLARSPRLASGGLITEGHLQLHGPESILPIRT